MRLLGDDRLTGGSPLTPLQAVQAAGRVFHLVRVTYPGDGMDHLSDLEILYLFDCNPADEACVSEEIDRDYLGNMGSYEMEVDEKARRVIIYPVDDEGARASTPTEVWFPSDPPPRGGTLP